MTKVQSDIISKHFEKIRENLGCDASTIETYLSDLEDAINSVDLGLVPRLPREE